MNTKKAVLIIGIVLIAAVAAVALFWPKGLTGSNKDKIDLGFKYICESKYEEAILAYSEAIKIDSKNVAAYQGISLAYVLQQEPDKAEQILQQGLQEIPKDSQLQLTLAGLLSDQGQDAEVEAIYISLLKSQPGSLTVYQAYYHWLASRGRLQEAAELLESADLDSEKYQGQNMLAGLYKDMGNDGRSLAAIRKSLDLKYDQSVAYELAEGYDLSALANEYLQNNEVVIGNLLKLRSLYQKGQYTAVIDQYKVAGRELQDSSQGKYILVKAFLQLQQKQQAQDIVKEIAADKVGDADLLSDLAACCLELGDAAEARELALKGINLDKTCINNYLIMYRTYAGVDSIQARKWALQYMMNSGLGYVSQAGFYEGSFTGQYTGSESGSFVAVIGRDKRIKVIAQSPTLGTVNGGGYLGESGTMSFETSGSMVGGSARVFTSVFQGRLQILNGERKAAGTWSSREIPSYGGGWSINPVKWTSSSQSVLDLFNAQGK